jgi:hypothetical protein
VWKHDVWGYLRHNTQEIIRVHDSSGAAFLANDNWRGTQELELFYPDSADERCL